MKKTIENFVVGLLIVILVAQILSILPASVVNANSPPSEFQASYSTSPPSIDGFLNHEWDDANSYDISLSNASDTQVPATVYFKHDGMNIYLGLKVFAGDHDFDQFLVYFDEGDDGLYGNGTGDGVLTTNQEDLKACFSPSINGSMIEDGCYKGGWYGYWGGDFVAACVFVVDHWECEFSIPFVGHDGGSLDVSDLVCGITDTIGIKIQYFTNDLPGTNNYYYPAGGNIQIETYTTLSFAHSTVSVTPNPAYPNQVVQISGQVTPAAIYSLRIDLLDPNGNYQVVGSIYTDSAGHFQMSYVPPGGLGSYSIQVIDVGDINNPVVLATTNFDVVLAPGITVRNTVVGEIPPDPWNYLITDNEGTVLADFTLPADGGGSFSVPSLEPGTYWLAQTNKFNYATSITVDDVAVPGETVENMFSLTLDLLPGDAVSVVFNDALIPDAAWGKPAGGSDPSTPSMMTYNVPCRRAVPVQVAWNPNIEPDTRIDLVKDKPTKILVNLSDVLTPTGPVPSTDSANSVTISVTSLNGWFNPLQATTSGQGIKNNHITIFTPSPPSILGDDTLTCTITYGASQISQETTFVSVKETSELALYYSHLYRSDSYGTEPADAYATMLANTRDFINAVYPVPKLTVDSNAQGLAGEAVQPDYVGMLKDCQNLALQAKLRFPNSPNAIGIAIGPDLLAGGSYKNYFAYHGAVSGKKTAVGVSFGPGVKGVVVLDGYYSVAAHEIGHTFGLYYGVPEQYVSYNPGMPCNGFWAEQNQWRTGYDFMGLSPYRSTANVWVNTDSTFEPLFPSLKTPNDPQILLVNGIIYEDGTVELPYSWYSMPYGTPDTVPTGESPRFALRFTRADGSIVETSFDAPFFMDLDPGIAVGEDLPEDFSGFGNIPTNFAGFAFATPYPQGTVTIDLVDKRDGGDEVIATIDQESVVSSVSAYFGGFLQPINSDGSSIFKLKSTVPIKFQLQEPQGTFITTATARLYYAKISNNVAGDCVEAVSTSAATTGNLFRYDPTSNQYIFNLSTKSLTAGTWQLKVTFDDGISKTVLISLK